MLVFRQAQRKLSWKARCFLQLIQDGSFLDARSQSKFDVAKSEVCRDCGVPDSHFHRCFQCQRFAEVHRKHQWIIALDSAMSMAMKAHLLPSRSPWWTTYKQLLDEPSRDERQALCHATRVDLFTDGSCLLPNVPALTLGAWAVICAQQDTWVARGTLTGSRQHNDQAELEAIRAALDVAVSFPGEVCIWSDSAYASTGLRRLILNDQDIPEDLGDGRWTAIQALIRLACVLALLLCSMYPHIVTPGSNQIQWMNGQLIGILVQTEKLAEHIR